MTYLIGLLSGVVLFVILGACLYIGYRLGNKKKPTKTDIAITEEEKRKAAAIQQHFSNLMNYDVNVALQRKRVD